jgi:hypothetical protein
VFATDCAVFGWRKNANHQLQHEGTMEDKALAAREIDNTEI